MKYNGTCAVFSEISKMPDVSCSMGDEGNSSVPKELVIIILIDSFVPLFESDSTSQSLGATSPDFLSSILWSASTSEV